MKRSHESGRDLWEPGGLYRAGGTPSESERRVGVLHRQSRRKLPFFATTATQAFLCGAAAAWGTASVMVPTIALSAATCPQIAWTEAGGPPPIRKLGTDPRLGARSGEPSLSVPGDPPGAFHLAKIEDASRLGKNWDGQGADPPSELAIRNANDALRALVEAGSPPDDAVADVAGGLALWFFAGGPQGDARQAAIECLNSGSIILVFEELQPHHVETAKVDDIMTAVERIKTWRGVPA